MPVRRVVIADDHAVVRTGYRRRLKLEPSLHVVAECADGERAYRRLCEHTAGVLILDLSMPGQGGLASLRRLHRRVRSLLALIFSMHQSPMLAMRVFGSGAAALPLSSLTSHTFSARPRIGERRVASAPRLAGMADIAPAALPACRHVVMREHFSWCPRLLRYYRVSSCGECPVWRHVITSIAKKFAVRCFGGRWPQRCPARYPWHAARHAGDGRSTGHGLRGHPSPARHACWQAP